MNLEVLLVFAVLAVTIALFVTEKIRVDVIAILIMVSLPWLGLVTAGEAISGFASNAVVSIIGVMILGHGVDRTGLIADLTAPLLRFAGTSEKRLVGVVSGAVGGISAFMQNIGAAALFLPAVIRISKRLQRPPSRLLMPMGFAAILGGTLTMVASGPLIILNDLLAQSGESPYGLFSVTPLGLALLGSGIVYFLVAGPRVLPVSETDEVLGDPQREVARAWGLSRTLFCVEIAHGSPLDGKTIDEAALWTHYNLHIVVLKERGQVHFVPWREIRLESGQSLGLLGGKEDVARFAADNRLTIYEDEGTLLDELQQEISGAFAEVMVHPRSPFVGKTMREVQLRRNYGVEPVLLASGDEVAHHDFSDHPFRSGDTLVVYARRKQLRDLAADDDFVLLTRIEDPPASRRTKLVAALCFVGAVSLAVGGFPLSISLLTGALVMVLTRTITIDEAYAAVEWRTVFLLAGLIPLGIAMDNTGAAAVVADWLTGQLSSAPVLVTLFAVSLLATLFSLFMSNVAATVLLVPLVMLLGGNSGIDPRGLALLVAISASNSFVLPTHQVNALLMGPGGYRNRDYLRAGGLMSLIFFAVAVGFVYLFYLG